MARKPGLRPRPSALPALFLAAAFATAFWLRMVPAVNNAHVDFQGDAALNYRLGQQLSLRGVFLLKDRMRLTPDGVRTESAVPSFSLKALAATEPIEKRLGGARELKAHVFHFQAVCGALIVLPAFMAAFALTRCQVSAGAAALLAAALPLGALRSHAVHFTTEAAGALLCAFTLAFLLRAITCGDRGRSHRDAFFAALCLIYALGTWRGAAFFAAALAACFAVAIAARRDSAVFERCAVWVALGHYGASRQIGYLADNDWSAAPESVFIASVGLGAAALALRRHSGGAGAAEKRAVMAAAAAALALAAAFTRNGYSRIHWEMGLARWSAALAKLGVPTPAGESGFHARLLPGDGVPLWDWAAPGRFSLAALLLAASIWFFVRRPKSVWTDPGRFFLASISAVLAGALCVTSGVAVLMSWLVAVGAAVMVHRLAAPGTAEASQRRTAARVIVGIALLKTLFDCGSTMISLKYGAVQMPPSMAQVMGLLRHNTGGGSVVWSDWQTAFEVQTHADRPTVLDGGFERPEMRERLIEATTALMSTEEQDLIVFCRRYKAAYIVLGSYWKDLPARYRGGPVEGEPNIARMFRDPKSMKSLQALKIDGVFLVFFVPEVGNPQGALKARGRFTMLPMEPSPVLPP